METTECTEEIGAAVDEAIRKFALRLRSDDLELSIADFTRLMQIRKEYEGAQRRAITVRWVNEWSKSSETEE